MKKYSDVLGNISNQKLSKLDRNDSKIICKQLVKQTQIMLTTWRDTFRFDPIANQFVLTTINGVRFAFKLRIDVNKCAFNVLSLHKNSVLDTVDVNAFARWFDTFVTTLHGNGQANDKDFYKNYHV